MILVTGGTGLVGARLLYDLAKEGKNVRALKRPESPTTLFDLWIKDEPGLAPHIEWVEGDLLDIFSLEEALKGIDTLYNCAAIVSFDPKHASLMEKTNIEGTANLVNLCLEKGDLKHFCHVSSVSSLGRETEKNVIDEHCEWIPGTHNSNYAVSKYGAEREIWRGIAEGLPAVIVNPTIILGPGIWHRGSAALFYKILKGLPFYTDGISGFVDVADVSAAMRLLIEKEITGERYILNSDNITFKMLFDSIAAELNVKPPSLKVRKWMSAIIWRLEALRTAISGKSPFITKETARSAHKVYSYSNEKMIALGFSFLPLQETIANTCKRLLADNPA
jgi:dihydroflavonol-4-reductase